MIFSVLKVVAPLLAVSSSANAHIMDNSLVSRNLGRQHPKLSAVTVRSRLHTREEAFKPKMECTHEYAEGMLNYSSSHYRGLYSCSESPSLPGWNSRFAKTDTKYKLPALVLEDIEEDVADIRCSDSTITVEFSESHSLKAVRPSWDNLGPFLIISSHIGCNEDGERKPYLVSGIHYDTSKSTVNFSVKTLEWRQAYDTMTVKFGSKSGKYPSTSFRTHEGLRRRQGGGIASASTTFSAPEPTSAGFRTSVDLANPFNSSQKLDPNLSLFEFTSTLVYLRKLQHS
jgi:hypothetical protein